MNTTKKKLTMLIADDSYPIRALLDETFKSEFNVLLAENGLEAIELLKIHEEIVIAIIDMFMPGTDGFKVVSEIFSGNRQFKIPVIMITASDNPADEIHAVDLGATDVMHKPLNLEILKHKVRNLLAFTAQTAGGSQNLMKLIIEHNEIDEKTGLYNKVAFCNAARRFIDNNRSTQFILIRWDVDGFKVLNDVYGISEGDRFLRSVGDFVSKYANDKYVTGRWEADHFVACMKKEDFNCSRILQNIDNSLRTDDFGFDIVIRMGVYVVDDPSIDIALMCDRALMALKSIKGDYTNRVAFYDENMRAQLIEAQQITNEMESALEKGQFTVYLQPQINYADNTLHGAEALVRWKHPVKGLIPPNSFIPIFEKNGFITHLDTFVWNEVCKLLRQWIDKGYEVVPVSVNVSRIDIYSLRLTEHFQNLVQKYGLDPSLIRIEITESAYIDNPSHLINSLEKLRKAGYSVEMDDFGSGYSSLNTLKDVPFDLLKLDMKFIDSNSEDSKGGSILSSVVNMSKRLNIPVIAEGVETRAQADYLKSIGCIYMQGFYFSKPIPAIEFEKMLITNAKEGLRFHSYEEDTAALGFLNASTQHTLIFNSFVGGAAIVEFDGDRVEPIRINDQFYDVLDLRREDFVNKSISLLDYLNDVNRVKFVNCLCKAIERKGQDECDISVKLKEDKELWIKIGAKLLVTVRERHLFYLSIENITHKMDLLLNNLRLNEKLTGIINSIPGGIIDLEIRDGSMIVNYINNTLCDMFGYTQEEYSQMASKGHDNVIYKDDLPGVLATESDLVNGRKEIVENNFRHICKDGKYKWVVFSGAVTRRTERSIFVTGIILDFDYQMRFEQNAIDLRKAFEKKLALNTALISSFPCGILQYAKKDGAYSIFSCNEAAYKYLGFSNRAALMNEYLKLGENIPVRPEDEAKRDALIKKVLTMTNGEAAEDRLYIKNAEGGYTPAVVRIQSVEYPGDSSYIQYLLMF